MMRMEAAGRELPGEQRSQDGSLIGEEQHTHARPVE